MVLRDPQSHTAAISSDHIIVVRAMDCSRSQRARGAQNVLPAAVLLHVAKLLPAADLGRIEATSCAWRAAVEHVVRGRAAEWGGFGACAVERVDGESWAGLLRFIEMRARGCVAACGRWTSM